MRRKYEIIPKDETKETFMRVRKDSKTYREFKKKRMRELYFNHYGRNPPKGFPIRKWYKSFNRGAFSSSGMLWMAALLMLSLDMDNIQWEEERKE